MATDDEIKNGINGVNFESRVHAPGETARAWFRSKVDPTLWCKGDTSSDELDGHYFAWYLYHDLVADDAEKKEIAAVVRRVTDHIMANNLTLVDHTGRKTRWGIWAPELINRNPVLLRAAAAQLDRDPVVPQGRRAHHGRRPLRPCVRRPDPEAPLSAQFADDAPDTPRAGGRTSTIPTTNCSTWSIIRSCVSRKTRPAGGS